MKHNEKNVFNPRISMGLQSSKH